MTACSPSGPSGPRRRLRAGDAIDALVISRVHASGLGEGDASGVAVLVAGAAPGDVVDARVSHVSPHAPPTAWAEVVQVRARGEAFSPPPCPRWAPLHGQCGGCPLMHLSTPAQARWKRAQVQACVDAAAPDAGVEVAWFASDAPLGYRNRAHYVAALDPEGAPVLGAYIPRTHDVAPQAGCAVVHPLIDATAQGLARALRALSIPIHPAPAAARYVTLRVAPSLPAQADWGDAPRCLVEWVCTDLDAPWLPALLDATCALPGVAGAGASLNTSGGNALHAAPPTRWRGPRALTERVGPLAIDLTTDAFFQLNAAVAARMYARAADLLAPHLPSGACLWDLYCGAGALGATAALRLQAGALCGAEFNPSAVVAAQALARAAHIPDARFVALDLSRDPLPAGWPSPDAVFVNPPRQGVSPPLLTALAASPARHLLYMSCSPTTLARDLRGLLAAGWRLDAAEAHDMLPQTTHVEALTYLRRP